MPTATRIIESPTWWNGNTHIYSLSTPYEGHDYIAVEVMSVAEAGSWRSAGVQVVGCDVDGVAASMDALYQSYEVGTHADVLERCGFTLTDGEDSNA